MRTLQEKYNGINEGRFSKEQFLRDVRLQLPNLITQYNGYDDAVQILKNRGMIREGLGDKQYLDAIRNSDANSVNSAKKILKKKFKDLDDKYIEDLAKEWARRALDEARLTKKNLADYRYKPTNDLDKYPYEQILRGLRVELEGMQVTGTPTAEDYKKALTKVLKNLQKDEIFYTNQIAGTNKKVNNHDQMIPIQGKEKEIKNNVDSFNGLKKAQLKEGFKNLIKKVLSENTDSLHDYHKSKESKEPISEAPASNNPKVEKLVDGINHLISQAIEDGEPVGVIWPGGTWDEPYIYQPIQYKNGQLKITSKSVYGGEPETEVIRSRDIEVDGLPMLRTLTRMYKKAIKNLGSNVNEGNGPVEKTVNLKKLHKIAMKAGNFGSDVKDALLNLYMGYGDKVPVSAIKKVLGKYDLTFTDLKDEPATFIPSSEFAHLFNSSEELKETGKDVTGTPNATGEYEIMMHMLDAGIKTYPEAAKFFSLNYSNMPEQQIKFLTNLYFERYQDEEASVDTNSHEEDLDTLNISTN
ncbi:MAG TPA: hypothetical protein PKC87_02525 [Candidatus Absconditabacterales bacterium]|nr:hypothetical protein [Candidatus Absconditabacterales bacterium]